MAAGGGTDRIEQWARCLRVGVTGHRLARLADADLPALEDGVRVALGSIAAALPGPPTTLHLVSSLADGADSIAADIALALGWRLDVVLPMPRDIYAADFAPGTAQAAHDAQIAASNALITLPIDGESEDDRAAAYERAGRVVLAQSDILVAIWDGQPARGRGGAAQIIAEAVLRGIPVIHVDPTVPAAPTLLWDGLGEHDFGQQSVETVSRGGLDRVAELVAGMTCRPPDPIADQLLASIERGTRRPRRRFAIAYPLLLATMGVRRLTRSDLIGSPHDPAAALVTDGPGVEPREAVTRRRLMTWFLRADANAILAGQTFRSAYVTNFALAALSVVISLSGLALPSSTKTVVALGELATIAAILTVTHLGQRAQWHRRWLDQRHLAERLRCLLLASRLCELGLRRGRAAEGSWVTWTMHAAGRMVGLPCALIDDAYLSTVRADLLVLLDDQIDYLDRDARRMHTLEHRMHRLGAALFAATALICVVMVGLQLVGLAIGFHKSPGLSTAATFAGAALPACGAAIYGIRMQSDFAGIAERSATLAVRLRALRNLVRSDPLHFDLLSRRARRATDLLTDDVSTWLHTYRARPLALPG